MTIPTKFRNDIGSDVVISFEFENTLVIRSKFEFDKWSELLISKGTLNKNARKLQRFILGNSSEITVDSKGRILIPKSLSESANLESVVQVVGVGNKIEIVSNSSWIKMIEDNDENISIEDAAEALED